VEFVAKLMPENGSIALEQYKLAVEMADRISARRAGANSFFVTLNAALAAVVGLLAAARETGPHANTPSFDSFGLSLAAIAGIVLSLTWWAILRYYRRLNRAKFIVINEMEKALPEHPYAREWEILHPEEAATPVSGETGFKGWLRRGRHREASVVEQVVPFVFAAIYLALVARVISIR
jgi:hypothetical protein